MARPSKAERRLIDFSREAFGEHLSELLLYGYSEERKLSSRDFIVELADDESPQRQLRLMFVAEGPSSIQPSLPHGKEALVILALLKLLVRKGGGATYTLTYTRKELFKLLGWNDTAQLRELLDVSVTKYFHTFYQLSDDSSDKSKSSKPERTIKIRTLTGQYFVSGKGTSSSNSKTDAVTFNIDFIEPLKERKLLGIDWNQVNSLITLPVEFFNL
jgi:hypothetical protein